MQIFIKSSKNNKTINSNLKLAINTHVMSFFYFTSKEEKWLAIKELGINLHSVTPPMLLLKSVHFLNTVAQSSFLSKLWSFSI